MTIPFSFPFLSLITCIRLIFSLHYSMQPILHMHNSRRKQSCRALFSLPIFLSYKVPYSRRLTSLFFKHLSILSHNNLLIAQIFKNCTSDLLLPLLGHIPYSTHASIRSKDIIVKIHSLPSPIPCRQEISVIIFVSPYNCISQ